MPRNRELEGGASELFGFETLRFPDPLRGSGFTVEVFTDQGHQHALCLPGKMRNYREDCLLDYCVGISLDRTGNASKRV